MPCRVTDVVHWCHGQVSLGFKIFLLSGDGAGLILVLSLGLPGTRMTFYFICFFIIYYYHTHTLILLEAEPT